jgi:hypothetical protein
MICYAATREFLFDDNLAFIVPGSETEACLAQINADESDVHMMILRLFAAESSHLRLIQAADHLISRLPGTDLVRTE